MSNHASSKHIAQSFALTWKAASKTVLCGMLLAACLSETQAPRGGQGTFSLGLTTNGLTAEIVTRAPRPLTLSEASVYMVTLTDADETLWQHKVFADITLADRTQPLGEGYVVMAENITSDIAESGNNGWGERRYAGSSAPFAIVNGQNTHVTVTCAMANAGLCVTFDDSFTSYFTDYAVTTNDVRTLKFNADNAETAMAYYNTEPATTIDVPIIISASAGWDGTVRLTRNLTLQKGKITRLAVKLNSPEPTEGNISVFAITYDDFMEEGTTEEITLE